MIENSFGIVAARFRVFRRPIIAQVETANLITKAVVALHNSLMVTQRRNNEYQYCPKAMLIKTVINLVNEEEKQRIYWTRS